MKPHKIVWEKDKKQNPDEKKEVEALIKRLNEKIISSQENVKKSALILESWLKKKSKP